MTAVMFIGDSTDIPAIRRHLVSLPEDAYGQVYLEVASEIQIQRWSVQAGVTVTWLCRDAQCGVTGQIAPRGELAARALEAWVTEWMPEEADGDDQILLWIGCFASPRVGELYDALAERLTPVED